MSDNYNPNKAYNPESAMPQPDGSVPRTDHAPHIQHATHTEEDRKWARKRIARRRGVINHAAAYVVVNLFLIVVWWMTGAGYFWPGWVLAGWGVGLVLDAADMLVQRDITEEQIENELRNRG